MAAETVQTPVAPVSRSDHPSVGAGAISFLGGEVKRKTERSGYGTFLFIPFPSREGKAQTICPILPTF